MARADSQGMFWHDEAKVKAAPKEKVKRTPPDPFWLRGDYLPGLDEALRFAVPLMTDIDLVNASIAKERLVYDIESYPNYFLIAFKSLRTGKVVYFEQSDDLALGVGLDIPKLKWVLENFCIVSFNGINYDAPIAALSVAGFHESKLFQATTDIIVMQERPHEVLKKYKVKPLDLNHIDLKEVAPLHDSLKIYAGRLHVRRMQDLPFPPGTELTENQMAIVRYYCVNDLNSTELLYNELEPAILLRETMSQEYQVDLRSRSDAQVAESVILSGLKKITGKRKFDRPEIEVGKRFKYQIPKYLKYETPLLNWVLDQVREAQFTIGFNGDVEKAAGFPMQFRIADADYTLGIGGLHSCEKSVSHYAGEDWYLIDRDVSSFYPTVILSQCLYPKHLGSEFIRVYKTIVDRRLKAKALAAKIKKEYKGLVMPPEMQAKLAEATLTADSLKITINGSFGKFGNAFSMLYSPNLMLQVTLTGQLVLLMLIERLELAGIKVISANTDGVVIKCHKTQKEKLDDIIKQWEKDIDCETEETRYKSIHNRDVNNYFAIKEDGEIKVKGVYAEKGSAGNSVLSKNPQALISSDAVKKFLLDGTPVDHTIRACKDIRRFVCVRSVKSKPGQQGGAVKVYNDGVNQNEYLGKAIRWYYSSTVTGEIVNALNGNKISMTDGARPLMTLCNEIPEDMNYDWYIEKANKILEEIAA